MTPRQERPPTDGELEAMAYVDGELEPEAARRFEERMARAPELAREVAELRALELVARQMAPPEPMDWEWERLEAEGLRRSGYRLGFALALLGAVGGLAWMAFLVGTADDLELAPKLLILGLGGGLALVFLLVLRDRLRTRPYDPYTKVKR